MATIRRRGARWNAQIKLSGGATRSASFATRALAQQWADGMEARKRSGEAISTGAEAITLAALWPGYMALRESEKIAPNTLAKNRTHWRLHVAPAFGDTPVKRIRQSQVRAWVAASLNAGIGIPTMEASLRLLSGMLKMAVADDLINGDPTTGVKVGAYKAEEKAILTPTQWRAVLAQVPNETDRLMLEMMAVTGLRIGEALGLRGSDLDASQGLIHVRQTWTRHGIKEGTKSNRGRMTKGRQVPCPAGLMARLEEAAPSPAARLFVGDDRNINRRVLAPACQRAGVPVVTLHSLRHYAITRLLDAGLSTTRVAKVMGHADTRMVDRIYSHMTTEGLEAAREAMEGL